LRICEYDGTKNGLRCLSLTGNIIKKRIMQSAAISLCIIMLTISSLSVCAEEAVPIDISAVSAVLMEATTGTVILEKNMDQPLSPASITKIMTLILIFDELESGRIQLSDEVVTSAYAKSMGGSQVFLEEGEIQTVETLIKCIVIASGNDASVAMAEHISGSEDAFVERMNQRAKELRMENTKFEDCCGLTDSASHVSSAKDVALMSRELITKYPEVYDYSTIWMENITHVTKQGSKEFCLSNTNKLLKTYEGAMGLKTGSTSLAKYCLSATAIRDGIHMIAVVMAAPDYKARFEEAEKMLNYGFANCRLYTDTVSAEDIPEVPVAGGLQKTIKAKCKDVFSFLCIHNENPEEITRKITIFEDLKAPVAQGQKVGNVEYIWNGTVIGEVSVVADELIEKAGFTDYFFLIIERFNRLMI